MGVALRRGNDLVEGSHPESRRPNRRDIEMSVHIAERSCENVCLARGSASYDTDHGSAHHRASPRPHSLLKITAMRGSRTSGAQRFIERLIGS